MRAAAEGAERFAGGKQSREGTRRRRGEATLTAVSRPAPELGGGSAPRSALSAVLDIFIPCINSFGASALRQL